MFFTGSNRKLIRSTALVLCFILGLGGYVSPVVASTGDVSRDQLGDRDSDKARVVSRLEEVGYSEEEAIARVSTMTADELAFFADHPESIERTGFIILASLIASSVNSSVKSGKVKKQKERDARVMVLKGELDVKEHEEVLAAAKGGEVPAGLRGDIIELRNLIKWLQSDIENTEAVFHSASSSTSD
jgi:hypothetical protein